MESEEVWGILSRHVCFKRELGRMERERFREKSRDGLDVSWFSLEVGGFSSGVFSLPRIFHALVLGILFPRPSFASMAIYRPGS